MTNAKKLSALLLLPLACGLMTSLTSCGMSFIPGDADTDSLDVNIDTKGVTITMWTGFGSKINGIMEELLDEFTQKTGIKVEYESKGGYPNLLKAINLASTSGSFPNIGCSNCSGCVIPVTITSENLTFRTGGFETWL